MKSINSIISIISNSIISNLLAQVYRKTGDWPIVIEDDEQWRSGQSIDRSFRIDILKTIRADN